MKTNRTSWLNAKTVKQKKIGRSGAKRTSLSAFNPKLRPQNLNIAVSAQPDGSGSSCPCQILLNGAPAQGAAVYPGQQINLSLSCGSLTPNSVQWSIDGTIFADWVVGSGGQTAKLTGVKDDAKKAQTMMFYWASVSGTQGYTVSVTYSGQAGASCTASATVQVVQPKFTFDFVYLGNPLPPPPAGQVEIFTDIAGVQGIGPKPDPHIIASSVEINANVQTPPSPTGQYGFYEVVQLVSFTNSIIKLPDGTCGTANVNGNPPMCDRQYPALPESTTEFDFEQTFEDKPRLLFVDPVTHSSYLGTKANVSFSTYLMFKPALVAGTSDVKWVPLAVYTWGYNACASGGPGSWTGSGAITEPSPSGSITSQNTTSHPQWTQLYNPNTATYTIGACSPGPFCS